MGMQAAKAGHFHEHQSRIAVDDVVADCVGVLWAVFEEMTKAPSFAAISEFPLPEVSGRPRDPIELSSAGEDRLSMGLA